MNLNTKADKELIKSYKINKKEITRGEWKQLGRAGGQNHTNKTRRNTTKHTTHDTEQNAKTRQEVAAQRHSHTPANLTPGHGGEQSRDKTKANHNKRATKQR